MGLIGQVWTRGMPVELTGTNSPKAYTFMTGSCFCLRPLYGFEITTPWVCYCCPRFVWGGHRRFTVVIARGKHPVPSRTRKLRLFAPMVLHWRRCGRVGHRRFLIGILEGPGLIVQGLFVLSIKNLTPTFYTLSGARAKRPAPALT